MAITAQNITKHELIGLRGEVVESRNKDNLNIKGEIVNETHHTLDIQTPEGVKKVFKKNVVLRIRLPSSQIVEVDGGVIEMKPWDRIKSR